MLLDDDEHAIAMVNAILGTARSKAEAFAIIEILVVGVGLETGFRSIPPNVYFMLVKIDERDA